MRNYPAGGPFHRDNSYAILPLPETDLLELQSLAASDPARAETAWDRLIGRNSKLLLKVAHAAGGGYDDALDRYAYVLEKLREDQFRRLRQYTSDGNTRFTTWLVVVAQRLVADQRRARYGRFRATTGLQAAEVRRSLVDWRVTDLLADTIPSADDVEADAAQHERSDTVRATIATLAAEDRLLLRLRHDDEVPIREIARLMAFPTVFHVYRRLNALYVTLRRALLDRGIDGQDE